jgi:hypothetical protein
MDSGVSQSIAPVALAKTDAGDAGEKSSAARFEDFKGQSANQTVASPPALPAGATDEVVSKLLKSPDNSAAAAGQLTPGEEKLYALLQEVKALLLANQGSSAPAPAGGDSAVAAAPDAAGGGSQAPPADVAGDKPAMYGDKAMTKDAPMPAEQQEYGKQVADNAAKDLGRTAEDAGAAASKNNDEESASRDDISEPMAKGLEAAGNAPSYAAPSNSGKSDAEQSYGAAADRAKVNGTSDREAEFLGKYAKALGIEDKVMAPDLGKLFMDELAAAMGDGKLTKKELEFLAKLIEKMGGNAGSLTQDKLIAMIDEVFKGAEAGGNNDLSPEAMKLLDGLLAMVGAPDGGGSADSGDSGGASADSGSQGSGRAQTTRAALPAGGGITGSNILASLYGSYLGGDEVSRLQKTLSGEDAADPLSGTATA